MPTRRRALIIIAALLGLAVLSLVVALAAGSLPVTAGDILGALGGGTGGLGLLGAADEQGVALVGGRC